MVPRSLTFSATPGNPFMVIFEVSSVEAVYLQGTGSAFAFARVAMASDTLGQGKAFEAPPGYSVGSESAGVVNGLFQPAPAAVPSMSMLGLVTLGAAVLGIGARSLNRNCH
jgi:hypothetical protein